jgi:beta-glucuronidase
MSKTGVSIMRLILFITLVTGISAQPARRQTGELPQVVPNILPGPVMSVDDGQDVVMNRLFRTTTVRRQTSLAGIWDFKADPLDAGESLGFPSRFPRPDTQVWLPGSWNTIPRYWQYQGTAWFRRRFEIRDEGILRICFSGVFYHARVWLDGVFVGEHEGGYSPFSFVVKDIRRGNHELTVRADNRLSDETLPKRGVDWFPYGGIHRPVFLEQVAATYIDNFHVIVTAIESRRAALLVRVFVRNLGEGAVVRSVEFSVDGKALHSGTHKVPPGESTLEFRTAVENPRLWSPEDPYLYSAKVALGGGEDDQFSRFGIRSFAAKGNQILLNGCRFKLRGANRHEDHPDWGPSLPPHLLRQDLEILMRLGANAVRGHYPFSDLFMDYCDQSGIVVLSEIPSWQYDSSQLARRSIQEKIRHQYFEMVRRDMNHPSILSWSLGNEWPDFDQSYEQIRSLVDYARSVDSTHFITFVTGGAKVGRPNELIDIICTNWAQYQWYEPSTYLDEAEGSKSIALLEEIRRHFPNKPVILTEFGGAESQAGWHNWGNVKWSEEYQARNVFDSGNYSLEQDWISGGCVWQFCDTRTDPSRMLGPRLRGWNAKGVLDAYRQPKMAFYRLQDLYHHFNERRNP